MTVTRSPAAREMARRMLARAVAADDAAVAGAELERTAEQVTESLRRTVGDDGNQALFARALALTEGEYPMLSDMFRRRDPGARLDVTAVVAEWGLASVTTALEVLLAALIDILSGLVGADMVRDILDPEPPPPRAGPTP